MVHNGSGQRLLGSAQLAHQVLVSLVRVAHHRHPVAHKQLYHSHQSGHLNWDIIIRLVHHPGESDVICSRLKDFDHLVPLGPLARTRVVHVHRQKTLFIKNFPRFPDQEFHRLTGDHANHPCPIAEQLQGVNIPRPGNEAAQALDPAYQHLFSQQLLGQIPGRFVVFGELGIQR